MNTGSLKRALAALVGGLLLGVPVLGWAGPPGGPGALQGHGDPTINAQKARQPARHHWVRCHEAHNQGALKACEAELATCQEDLAACLAEPSAIFPGDGQTGAPLRYTDNGDGTFTDDNTGLMWEMKTNDGSIHDVDNRHTWTDPSDGDDTNPDGTVFTVFLAGLNDPQNPFAGYTDWRLPTVKELQSLVDYSTHSPSASVPGETTPDMAFYWSSTSHAVNANWAWDVDFGYGYVGICGKIADPDFTDYVRAVRGGW